MDVVLSHDWLTGMRGGEYVLDWLCRGFPSAPIYTLIYNPSAVSDTIHSHKIITSRLQHIPGIIKTYRYFLPFFPGAVERMHPPKSSLIISTSHCVAKGLHAPGTKHLCYCFTPMRYAWTFYEEYFGTNPVKRAILSPILAALREWDKKASDRVDLFVTLSKHVQKRIKLYYDRDSEVVYPPVNTDFYTIEGERPADFDLIVSALVPYKRIDLAVRTYTRSGFPLKIIGTGTEYETLKKVAGENIEFLGWRTNEEIRTLYRQARCLIFPGEEDFGIVPVEAQACGCPVVAYARGGALESLQRDETAVFFEEQTDDALLDAVEQCAGKQWDRSLIRSNAERFAPSEFILGMDRHIQQLIGT